MKALLCKTFGPPESLVLEDVPDPVAGKGQVVVTVKACGINFPDTLMIVDKYQFKPPMPFAPGGEVSGVVRSVGAGVTDLKVGDRVMAYMMHSGLAEQILLDASSCVKLPPGLDFVPAAAFVLTYGTALYGLQYRAHLQRGLPYAISRTVHYAIVVGGFLLAVAALGFDMTKFTILAGAFTVDLLSRSVLFGIREKKRRLAVEQAA